VQLRLPWGERPTRTRGRVLSVDGQTFPVEVVRRRGARRYVVRVTPDATLRLTVPYGASIAGGLSFVRRQAEWVAGEWQRISRQLAPWRIGSSCWFRGRPVEIIVRDGRVTLGDEDAGAWSAATDIRALVTARLRAVAATELPARCRTLAASVDLDVRRVSVRNQRSRWGACSSRGTVTLNWRLVQVPPAVRDYVIWHELAHLSVPNHSRRFWRRVDELCPAWREHERWLRTNEREFF